MTARRPERVRAWIRASARVHASADGMPVLAMRRSTGPDLTGSGVREAGANRGWPETGTRRSFPTEAPPPRETSLVRLSVGCVVSGPVPGVHRERAVVTVEDEAQGLGGIQRVQGLLDQPQRSLVGRDDDEEPVDPPRDDPAVRNRDRRGRVQDDVVVLLARLLQKIPEPRRLQNFVTRDRALTGGKHREREARVTPDHVAERRRG